MKMIYPAYLFFTCATPCQARGGQQTAILSLDVLVLDYRSNLRWLAVVEISGFEISIVSDWYISVILFFYAQALFYTLEVVNLMVWEIKRSKNPFFLVLPQLKNGWTFPYSLTDRNGVSHPDHFTLLSSVHLFPIKIGTGCFFPNGAFKSVWVEILCFWL